MKNVAVIGLGNISKRHRKNIKLRFPQANIYAVSSSGRNIEEKIEDCDLAFSSINDLKDIKLDFAIVASPASHHIQDALFFIERSIPVLIEKPLSVDTSSVHELIRVKKESKSKVAIAYCLRYLEPLLTLKNMLDKKQLGEIYHISISAGQNLNDWRPESKLQDTVSVNKVLGGGVLNELSHEFDYLYWLFGDILYQGGVLVKSKKFNIDVEDIADVLLFNFKNYPIQVHLDFHKEVPERYCHILCEIGYLDINLIENNIILHNKYGSTCLYENKCLSNNEKYLLMLDDFISYINGSGNNFISLEDGLKTVELIEVIKSKAKVCIQ